MTCNCKAELASILREEAKLIDNADGYKQAASYRRLADGIARLSPAPAETQPLTGWRAKCFIPKETSTDFYIAWSENNANTSSPTHWLCDDGQWHDQPHAFTHYMRFPTESAARAALLAASAPPNPFHADIEREMPKPSMKPAPASTPAFDPEKMMWKGQAEAWESVVKCCEGLGLDLGEGSGSGEQMVLRFIRGLAEPKRWPISDQARAEHLLRYCPFFRGIEETRNEIAAALTAAHAAGRAEGDAAGYRRGMADGAKWQKEGPCM